ncbi:DUF551 domain-containing protein [Klebsiella aerogenes]|uniref:DUF551 domain-containing protein n=1 Tax=Klebsiella aerogenes TaxID=548 RepID=UPI0035CED63E
MTKSTITRERLEEIILDNSASLEEFMAITRMALAAMDSEPVEWLNGCNKSVPAALRYLAENPRPIGGESSFNTAHLYQLAREIELMAEGTLYRHAHPAPVVPISFEEWSRICALQITLCYPDFREKAQYIWDSARETMQPAPVVMDDEKLRALFDAWFASDCSFDLSPEASEEDNIAWRESYWYVWQRCRAAMLHDEPVTTANKLGSSPVQSPIDHGYRKGCECSGCKTTVRICAELAGWTPVSEQMPGRYYVLAADFSGRHYPPNQPNTQVGIHDDWFGDGKPTWDDGDGNDLHLKQVTHWMPLPSAPQEVKGE